ncbi:MAG: hypothetical protein IPI35_34340 [Deltaproteobacteria bacterium]|nr:hypothetical protein [Deltaproteobacteria bacterium]
MGLIINLGSAWALSRADGDNLNIRGALAACSPTPLGSREHRRGRGGVVWYPGADPDQPVHRLDCAAQHLGPPLGRGQRGAAPVRAPGRER